MILCVFIAPVRWKLSSTSRRYFDLVSVTLIPGGWPLFQGPNAGGIFGKFLFLQRSLKFVLGSGSGVLFPGPALVKYCFNGEMPGY